MNREDDRQLWDLLGHSRVPEPSPFFARNVVRAIRNGAAPRSPLLSWFNLRWLVPSFSAVAALVVAIFTIHSLYRPVARTSPRIAVLNTPSATASPIAVASNIPDNELVTDLEVLSGPDDDSDDTASL